MSEPKKYEPTTKYLAIKDWAKYQAGTDRKGRQIMAWHKHNNSKDFDDTFYSGLTMFQRGLFDAICRARGRGVNIPANIEALSRTVQALSVDRPRLPQAMIVLVSCGLLIPTNQELDASETPSESETQPETETETETQVPPPVAAGSPLPSGEKATPKPVQGSLPSATPTATPKAVSTDLRDWSETIPGCNLTPQRIADCIRYQLDVKKNDYFIKRMSKGYVLQEWQRLDRDTPEDYFYDPDPMIVGVVVPGVGDEEDIVRKDIVRRPKNAKERKMLQGENFEKVTHNVKWLFKDPCPYGCNHGWHSVPNPDIPRMPLKEYCRCLGE
jgi:hypothetical protein